ncbi:translation initiation factor eIF2B subunit epsilon [Prorops nasuta]|uniref:translation initiation factor eIF2B subunit epsilon n=1 Tax=Prorops nasuta TaxID=863751 RepID=UPI0034CF12F8
MNSKLGKEKVLKVLVLVNNFTSESSFENKLNPDMLMNVVNVPLLDYLIETLIKSRVNEVFIYATSDIDAIKNYVKLKKSDDITITLVISDGCCSLGDALRDIDTKGLIRDHFILISFGAFIVTDLKAALAAHQIRTKKDKGATMTMLLRNVGAMNKSLLQEKSSVIVFNKSNKKVLYYQKLKKGDTNIKLELQYFLDHGEVEINTGLLDTQVYLCSPSLLPLFSDNFDFQTMEDFIRGVLINEEILDSRIYWKQLNEDDYALPVTNWISYDALSHDILHRLTYPLTPDHFQKLKISIYMLQKNYKHRICSITNGVLQKDSIVGSGSVLGKNISVKRSIIGDNCKIGNNTVIEDSYIFSNVTIKDNCYIKKCIIGTKCIVHKNVHCNLCFVCPEVSIHEKTKHKECCFYMEESKLVTKKFENDQLPFYNHIELTDNIACSTEDSSSEEESKPNSPIPDDTNMFLSEVIDSLLRGYQYKLNCENLILEINSSRYAYNVNIREVTFNVIKAILSLPLHYMSDIKQDINTVNYQKTLRAMISFFSVIISNYVKTEDAEEDCLKAIEDVASTTEVLMPFVQKLLHYFYENNILSEQKILDWHILKDEDEGFYSEKVREVVKPFIQWLQEAEEDSSESDE